MMGRLIGPRSVPAQEPRIAGRPDDHRVQRQRWPSRLLLWAHAYRSTLITGAMASDSESRSVPRSQACKTVEADRPQSASAWTSSASAFGHVSFRHVVDIPEELAEGL